MIRDSVFMLAAFFLMAAINYAFSVALGWLLPPEQFGQAGVAQSLLLLLALIVGSGFAWTTAHDIAARGTNDQTRRRFRAAWVANTTLGLLLAGGLWGAYAIHWLPLGPHYRAIVPLVGLTVILLAARSVVNGAARGLCRFDAIAVNLIGEVFIKAVGGLVLIALGTGATGVMAGFVLGAAAALAHSLWIVRSARLWHGQGWFDRQVVVVTFPLFLGVLGPALMMNLDLLGLQLLAPVGQGDQLAGFYQAAVILARTPIFIAQALTVVLFSHVAGSAGKQRGMEAWEHGKAMAIKAWTRLLLPAGLTLILAPETVLSLFFPAPYRVASSSLQVAAGGGLLLALVTLLNGVAQATGRWRQPAAAAGLGLIAQMLVLVGWVPRWGALGAAFSLWVAGFITLLALVSISPALFRFSSWKGFKGIAREILRPSLPLLALAIPLLVLPNGGSGVRILKLALAGLAYLGVLWGIHERADPAGNPPSVIQQLASVLIEH